MLPLKILIKHFDIVLLSLIYLLLKLSEEVTKYTHARYNFSLLKITTIYVIAKMAILAITYIVVILLGGSG